MGGDVLTILIVFALFIFLLALGLHISTTLLLVGIVGIYLLSGTQALSGILQVDPFNTVASYTLTTIPLFILMSQFIMQADIVKYLYSIVFKIARGFSSVLGIFTIILGGFLGAVSGSASAISASLGQVAVPELKRHGYPDASAAAIVAVAGSLSSIIPPSLGLIVYGALTQTPIGTLFIASIIPSILLIATFIGVFLFMYIRDGKDKESTLSEDESTVEDYSWKEYTTSIVAGTLIVASIFGGIYLGVFTPTEAGGIGAFISLLAALVLGKVNLDFFKKSIKSTLEITVMIMFIMIGAQIFARFISLSQLPRKLIGFLEPIMGMPTLVIILLLVLYFILFMFLEAASAVIMTIAITVPLAEAVGLSALEFGILLTVVGTAGLLTPPVGLSVFTVSGVTRIPIERIFRYALVYAIVGSIVVPLLLLLFPELITWLPSKM